MGIRLLVFINQSPYNELILRGQRKVKFGGNKINHVGLVLLYTSKSAPAPDGVEELKNPAEVKGIPRGAIVGACQFRCVSKSHGYEYHLSEPYRFCTPIPFTNRGPVRFFTTDVTPEIARQLRLVGLWERAIASDRSKRGR